MTIARKKLIDEEVEGIYHCTSRCVRRAFLCGEDRITGKDFTYRRDWILDRMKFLASIFAIDIASYGLEPNHLHGILRNRPDLRARLTPVEVVYRWKQLYPGKRNLDGNPIQPNPETVAVLAMDEAFVAKMRKRLGSPSWYMKALKEPCTCIWRRAATRAKWPKPTSIACCLDQHLVLLHGHGQRGWRRACPAAAAEDRLFGQGVQESPQASAGRRKAQHQTKAGRQDAGMGQKVPA